MNVFLKRNADLLEIDYNFFEEDSSGRTAFTLYGNMDGDHYNDNYSSITIYNLNNDKECEEIKKIIDEYLIKNN